MKNTSENKNNKISSGFYHNQTGVYFPNRKAAQIIMGINRYNKFLRNGEFKWENTEDYPIAY